MDLCHDRLVPRANTTAAIIAGGQARRLGGRDKSRLVVGGRPIIVRQVEILQRVAHTIQVVGVPPDRYADLGLVSCPDVLPGLGAIGGIYTALRSSPADLVLVVACDLPFLEAGLLERLADLASTHDGAWVATERGVEPLLACYRASSADRVKAAIEAGRLKAADLAGSLQIAVIGTAELCAYGPPDRLLANVNTPGDYARVQYDAS
jgi:molybdopterin-guanine dinucleotide biosynthesis protein A